MVYKIDTSHFRILGMLHLNVMLPISSAILITHKNVHYTLLRVWLIDCFVICILQGSNSTLILHVKWSSYQWFTSELCGISDSVGLSDSSVH